MFKFYGLLLLITVALAPTPAQQVSSVELDIAYGKDADSQKLDLYLPAKKGFATIVYTYGSGWHAGSGKSSKPIAEKLQTLGYGCALVSHRLTPPHTFPAHAQDIALAFAWVKQNISKRGGNPNKVILAGHSSGAHLSLLIATDPKYLAAHRLSPMDITAIIALSPPVDLQPKPDGHGYGDALLAGHGADAFRRDVALMKDASPIHHLAGTLPPTLIIVGEKDFPMLERDAEVFAKKAGEMGRKVEVVIAAGKDHLGIARGMLDETDPVLSNALRFLSEALKL